MAKTAAEFDSEIAAISAQRKALKKSMRELVGERDRLLAEETAAALVAGMSPAERKAIAQAISAAKA
jgi:hypothetical protein